MSLDRTHAHSASHSAPAPAGASASPGKQTQVERLQSPGGHGAHSGAEKREPAATVSGVNL